MFKGVNHEQDKENTSEISDQTENNESTDDFPADEDIMSEYQGFIDAMEEKLDESGYWLTRPITFSMCGRNIAETDYLNDIPLEAYVMFTVDDDKHIIPYMYEHLGITKDVYLCYAEMETWRDKEGYMEYEATFYFTDDETQEEMWESGELSESLVEWHWGKFVCKYNVGDRSFRYKCERLPDGTELNESVYVRY